MVRLLWLILLQHNKMFSKSKFLSAKVNEFWLIFNFHCNFLFFENISEKYKGAFYRSIEIIF